MTEPRTDRTSMRVLLDVVDRDRDERERAVAEKGEEHARSILREARTTARERVHRAVRQERARLREEVDRAAAGHAVRMRERRQRVARTLLDQAWGALPASLAARWADPEGQRAWVATLADVGARVLLPGRAQLEHPRQWDPTAHESSLDALGRWAGQPVDLQPADDIEVGLRLRVGEACLDATAAGLLADRRSVEGRLLTELLAGEGEP